MIINKLKSIGVSAAAAALIAAAPGTVLANSHDGNDNAHNKVTICHATGSTTHPFVQISPNANGVVNGHENHQDTRDIIPPFTYNDHGTTKSFAGQNWDANGQAIFNNGCKVTSTEGGQLDCDNDIDNSSAAECATTGGQTMDCDNDTDSSAASECVTTGGQGGGGGTTTITTTNTNTTTTSGGQVLGAATTGAQVQTPQGGVGAGLGGGSTAANTASFVGLGGSLLSLGTGLAWLNRRKA